MTAVEAVLQGHPIGSLLTYTHGAGSVRRWLLKDHPDIFISMYYPRWPGDGRPGRVTISVLDVAEHPDSWVNISTGEHIDSARRNVNSTRGVPVWSMTFSSPPANAAPHMPSTASTTWVGAGLALKLVLDEAAEALHDPAHLRVLAALMPDPER